jgi:hypothetical protein
MPRRAKEGGEVCPKCHIMQTRVMWPSGCEEWVGRDPARHSAPLCRTCPVVYTCFKCSYNAKPLANARPCDNPYPYYRCAYCPTQRGVTGQRGYVAVHTTDNQPPLSWYCETCLLNKQPQNTPPVTPQQTQSN